MRELFAWVFAVLFLLYSSQSVWFVLYSLLWPR
jgi:hypothetical protein